MRLKTSLWNGITSQITLKHLVFTNLKAVQSNAFSKLADNKIPLMLLSSVYSGMSLISLIGVLTYLPFIQAVWSRLIILVKIICFPFRKKASHHSRSLWTSCGIQWTLTYKEPLFLDLACCFRTIAYYLLFFQILIVSYKISYKVVSYMRDSTVLNLCKYSSQSFSVFRDPRLYSD